MTSAITRVFLTITGLMWIGFGFYLFIAPDALSQMAGVTARSATGVLELRAMYGGLQIGVGVLALIAGWSASWRRAGLWTLSFVYGGMALARIIAAIQMGEWSSYVVSAIAFDLPSALIAIALLRLQAPAAAAANIPHLAANT